MRRLEASWTGQAIQISLPFFVIKNKLFFSLRHVIEQFLQRLMSVRVPSFSLSKAWMAEIRNLLFGAKFQWPLKLSTRSPLSFATIFGSKPALKQTIKSFQMDLWQFYVGLIVMIPARTFAIPSSLQDEGKKARHPFNKNNIRFMFPVLGET